MITYSKPNEFIERRTSITGTPMERILHCKCGITAKTTASEFICPSCHTILIGSKDNKYGIYTYEKNENFYNEFVEWAYQEAEMDRREMIIKKININ
jgi:predicted RNA-binding Zn-ribbon protein involved in translation (DUF1610 family)